MAYNAASGNSHSRAWIFLMTGLVSVVTLAMFFVTRVFQFSKAAGGFCDCASLRAERQGGLCFAVRRMPVKYVHLSATRNSSTALPGHTLSNAKMSAQVG